MEEVKKIVNKIKSFLPEQQPVSSLNVSDVFLWKNYKLTGALFLATQLLYTLLAIYNYSVITLVFRTIQIHVIFSALFTIASRLLGTVTDKYEESHSSIRITQEGVEKIVNLIAESVENFRDYFLRGEHVTRRLVASGILLQVICSVGKRVSGINFAYYTLNILFIVPIIYLNNREVIDKQVSIYLKKLSDQLNKWIDKISHKP